MLGGAAGRFCTPSSVAGPFRLCAVTGFQNRTNDIVYCPPLIRGNDEESTAVVYFGGDVQVSMKIIPWSPFTTLEEKGSVRILRPSIVC